MINKKRYYFCLISVLFLVIFYFCFFDIKNNKNIHFLNNNEYFNFKDTIINSKKKNINIISYIKIKDNTCFYDNNSDFYLCYSEDPAIEDINIASSLDFSLISNSSYKLSNLDNFESIVYTDNYYYILNLRFTNIPIMNIITSLSLDSNKVSNISEINSDSYTQAYVSLIENENNTINSLASIRLHGHDSLSYDKKSYKLNLKKVENGKIVNNNIGLLGMYKDDDWVLDAMYVDESKVRNRLSSDLWSLISGDNVLNGQYIELFIDNNYVGLYSLKEYLNNKSLNVSTEGSIIKSLLFLNSYDDNFYIIDDKYFILKHPDTLNTSTNILLDKINTYYNYINNDEDISDFILKNFDIDNFLNYKIFIALIKGVDNNEHNNYYYSMYNKYSKITKTPWDMDLSFGFTFNRIYDYDKFDDMGFSLYYNNSPEINTLIKQKYWELRKKIITMENINYYLNEYEKILISSGSSKRDSDRWYYYDLKNEIENIRSWCFNRIEFLDNYFEYN